MPEAMAFAQAMAERSSMALFLSKVAMDPEPPQAHGMVGVYHMLASGACHDDPIYKARAGSYGKKDA
jgi:hypothetical protein